MMESILRGELDFTAGFREELRAELRADLQEDNCGIRWPSCPLSVDMHPASHFALAAAYHDIKMRLASLEHENSSIKRKLKNYEIKFPMISEFAEERSLCCSCEPKETKVIHTEASSSLQQRISTLTQELQKSKAHEEHLEEVIKAYEKIHLEKSNVQKELDNMTTLAEQHVKRIHGLESALRQRETLLQRKSSRLGSGREKTHPHSHPHPRSKDTHLLHLHNSLDVPCALDCPGPTLQSSRSLDTLTDLKVQRLEAELEGAWHEAQGAWQREAELKTKLQRLQDEISHLQENQRQELDTPCDHCNMEWIQKAGDEQVNLALAYTELTEELSRIRSLTAEQSEILRQKRKHPEQKSPVLRHSATPQHHSPSSPLSAASGPASFSPRTSTNHLRACFQGRRSFSEITDPSTPHQGSLRTLCYPASTLPKHRPAGDGYLRQQKGALSIGPRPASAHSATRSIPCASPVRNVHHLCVQEQLPDPAPLVTPPQSSEDEEEEWPSTSSAHSPVHSPTHSPPRTLGVMPPHPPFPAPDTPSTLSCPLQGYLSAEHAQSWPSIKLWMESEENDSRSCPLCQLTFPTGYPEDALIKHIDSHLENSKI
uniref:TBK1 binding protein 1 n=1 Tax=Astyanax mexicanus TaxID=7994 RepID=W5KL41_ASTMX